MPAAKVVVLLPPSETKRPDGDGPAWDVAAGGFGVLSDSRTLLLRELRKRGALARLDQDAAARTLLAEGAATMPALDRYTGVLFDALDVSSMPRALRRKAEERVAIVSGLAGLVRGGDPLPDYKLAIGTVVPRIGGLASWWKPRLSPALDEFVGGTVVWDLLPGAHSAAWTPGGSWRSRWRVRVLREATDGTRTVVSHDNKATKGALARHLLLTSARGPAELLDWVGPGGARLDPVTSSGDVLDIVAPAPVPAATAGRTAGRPAGRTAGRPAGRTAGRPVGGR